MPDKPNDKTPNKLTLVKPKTHRRGQQAVASTQARLNEKRAIDLRQAGMDYREIAEALDVSVSVAYEYVERVLALTAQNRENAEQVRTLELERLDKMQSRLWSRVLAGDHGADYLILKIMERRASYLGLNAPQRTEVTGADGGPIEVSMSARAALAAQLGIKLEDG